MGGEVSYTVPTSARSISVDIPGQGLTLGEWSMDAAWKVREALNKAADDGVLVDPLRDDFTSPSGGHVHARIGHDSDAGVLVFPARGDSYMLGRSRVDEFIEWLLAHREAGNIGTKGR